MPRQLPRAAIRTGPRGLRFWPVSDDKISFEYKVKRLLEGCLMPPERAHVYWNGTFSDAEKANAASNAPLPGALDRHSRRAAPEAGGGDGVSPYLWFDQKYYLPDDILMKVDRMSMAHAVEVRPPFLDHRIVEFAASLPAASQNSGLAPKSYSEGTDERQAAAIDPARERRSGFDIPAHEWLRGPLRPLLLETLASGEAEHGELFREARSMSA